MDGESILGKGHGDGKRAVHTRKTSRIRWSVSQSALTRASFAAAAFLAGAFGASPSAPAQVVSRDAGVADAGTRPRSDAGRADAGGSPRDAAPSLALHPVDSQAAGPDVAPTSRRAPNPLVMETTPPLAQVEPSDRTSVVVKALLGLVALLALAYLGGHPRVQRWEHRIGLSQLITAGLPFVALGVVARLPAVGILNDDVLASLAPVLRFALGWIGFIIGFRLDVRVIEAVPPGTVPFVGWRALITFASIAFAGVLVLLPFRGLTSEALTSAAFLRDALILATAGTLTSLATPRLLETRGGDPASVAAVSSVVRLEEVGGIAVLLLIPAFFRAQDVAWELPGTAWLLLTLGAGVASGILVYAILLRRATSAAEWLVLILGSVAFASGLAANLRVSPVVVCFVAGVLLSNFPGGYKDRLRETLTLLERPTYLLFLVIVGAMWRVDDWRGWLVLVLFVGARLAGKWLGTRVAARTTGLALSQDAHRALAVAPMGALSIAIVINAELLYAADSGSWLVTAIVGGAIVTEILVQGILRLSQKPAAAPPEAEPTPVLGPAPPEEPRAEEPAP
jgi:hypothetical protein